MKDDSGTNYVAVLLMDDTLPASVDSRAAESYPKFVGGYIATE
jgi:hypothetical protein